ncbi:unnamed protein product [[Actinomadura] parvosata subsp. kistnae]|uniref:Uncharacterized protein n=1 Tax=[Actinomadura] parvosata subsp. kistnae TaxID=1909395 RepID=A0A1U9ZT03_9ACTN|nr:hypothetical protein [Nonomuraea sp. ATCC 55076]AQZ61072.1 hypothetical protein BKM31_05855 [Nonomuraea sp. ATCC 55076]SPL87560.1 unnamed protein product [Actinomadura parvosata subsp. kistnae]
MRAVLAGGRLVSVGVEPWLTREPPETVAALVAEAVDAAFAGESPVDAAVPFVEPLALARELRAVRADLDARMARVTASIEVSAAALRARAGVPLLDFGELFDRLIEMLETIGGVPDGDVRGTSEGPVSAVCAPGPRLVALSVTARALYGGPRALGERVVDGVNAALDDLRYGLLRRRAEAGAGTEEIMARVEELRGLGVRRMRAYARAMAAMMDEVGAAGAVGPVTGGPSGGRGRRERVVGREP